MNTSKNKSKTPYEHQPINKKIKKQIVFNTNK